MTITNKSIEVSSSELTILHNNEQPEGQICILKDFVITNNSDIDSNVVCYVPSFDLESLDVGNVNHFTPLFDLAITQQVPSNSIASNTEFSLVCVSGQVFYVKTDLSNVNINFNVDDQSEYYSSEQYQTDLNNIPLPPIQF